MKLGTASLGCPSVVLKIGLCRVIRIGDVIIRVGTRLLVISGENINGRGVGCRARLSLHIPLAKVLEDLFNHIGIFYERDHPFLMAGRAKMATFARKGQKIFVTAISASDPGKPVFQNPAIQIPINHLFDTCPPMPSSRGCNIPGCFILYLVYLMQPMGGEAGG